MNWSLNFPTAPRNCLSALSERIERREELREGNRRGLGSVDLGISSRAQRSNGERHGDAMIVGGIDAGAVQRLIARNLQAVEILLQLGAHRTQVPSDQRNAIRLLDAQLLRVADDEPG